MPDVTTSTLNSLSDVALRLQNLRIDYLQSLIVAYEGHHFCATPTTILWLENQLAGMAIVRCVVSDSEGFPVKVDTGRSLLKLLRSTKAAADMKFFTATDEIDRETNGLLHNSMPPNENEE